MGPSAWRLANAARRTLAPRLGGWLPPAVRPHLVLDWATHRGRVATTEVSDLVGIAVNATGELLRGLEEQGHLEPGRANPSGRGFFYVPARGAVERAWS